LNILLLEAVAAVVEIHPVLVLPAAAVLADLERAQDFL
jgi:hypothetical protein